MSGDGSDLLKTLAQALGKLPNHVAIERHTDSKPYPPTAAYTNRELSADRANAARRLQYREKPAGAAGGNEAGASAEKTAQGHGKQESTGGGEPAAPKKEWS
jgi:flagellar motor protein MotB